MDLVIDAVALDDLLAQYFQSEDRNAPQFKESHHLSREVVRHLNRIVQGNGRYVVVASTLAFVELAYKWKRPELQVSQFQPYQLAAFLQQPPDWFVIADVNETLIAWYGRVPSAVEKQQGQMTYIEGMDAIHVATALSREEAKLVTADTKLLRMDNSMF